MQGNIKKACKQSMSNEEDTRAKRREQQNIEQKSKKEIVRVKEQEQEKE